MKPNQDQRFHEFACIFPMLQGEALAALREDIRQHGIREPVVFFNGEILDGRNRYVCALELGIDVPTMEYSGDDPLGFVISHNLHRRHLSESQRASIAARVANMPSHRPKKSANWRSNDEPLVSSSDAAEMLNVSTRAVERARKVQKEAPPEIVQAVDDGRVSVSLAAKVAALPEDQQAKVAAAPDIKQAARDAVKPAPKKENPQGGNPAGRGVGVDCALEAINALKKIPINDGLRQDAFNMVINYINSNR